MSLYGIVRIHSSSLSAVWSWSAQPTFEATNVKLDWIGSLEEPERRAVPESMMRAETSGSSG